MLLAVGAALLLVLQLTLIVLVLIERQLLLDTVADLHLLARRVLAIERNDPNQ